MESLSETLKFVDDLVWGPVMLLFLMGTGIFLTIRTRFLPWKNLGYAIRSTFGRDSLENGRENGDISPFSALATSLAATIGTGNIVGVATAMAAGGPGALVWMCISACFGLSVKFSECMLAVKYREVNANGEMSGGPMYTMKNAFRHKALGRALGWIFALFTVVASFGIGNMTQGNSISESMLTTFGIEPSLTGIVVTVVAIIVIVGGIKNISKVATYVVPFMAAFYMLCGVLVIAGNYRNLPEGMLMIFKMAFSFRAAGGALAGNITASVVGAMRYGIARGCFSNEAGMGSAAIPACAASTGSPVKQGYISMTDTFWDTIVVCTITGVAIACSGVLGTINPSTGRPYTGSALTIAAFKTVLGPAGGWMVCIGIALFAFATILGWEYFGEKAFEYLFKTPRYNVIYRLLFSFTIFIGANAALDIVWNFSDIANALMVVPNLICLLALNREVARDIRDYQKVIDAGKRNVPRTRGIK